MRKNRVLSLAAGLSLLAGAALAQTHAGRRDRRYECHRSSPAAAPAATTPATPPPSNFTHWGTDFSFLLDGYVDGNFNNPDSGYNQLRNFDFRANTVHINMGKITIDHAPAPLGFHLDVGFGQTFDVIHSGNRDAGRVQILRAGLCQLETEILEGRGGGCRRIRNLGGRGGYRDQFRTGITRARCCSRGPSPTIILARESRFPLGRISPAASRWCRAGTTSIPSTAARRTA